MKKWLIMLFAVLAMFTITCLKTNRNSSDRVISVSSEEAEMNKIIENARKSVPQFVEALTSPKANQTEFTVKYPFKTDRGSGIELEHIWLAEIKKENNVWYGIVANDPNYIKKMKFGDRTGFDINNISDWKYLEDGYMVGGESIRYFYDRASDAEKKEFDETSGIKFRK